MTIGIHVTTGPHKARISRTGFDDVIIGPGADQHFAAYPGCAVTVTEAEAVVTADSGDNGPRPGGTSGKN